jgi:hypothetical protein
VEKAAGHGQTVSVAGIELSILVKVIRETISEYAHSTPGF